MYHEELYRGEPYRREINRTELFIGPCTYSDEMSRTEMLIGELYHVELYH